MSDRPDRFLAFVDYLGTRDLYRDPRENAGRIEDRRYELEHGVQIRLQRLLAEQKIELGVFSDTVLIAGRDIQDVLVGAASLLDFVFRKNLQRSDPGDFRLLRGGVAKGVELRSSYLRPSRSVSIIPFFDGSLAFAYETEGLRRGSRVFLSDELRASDLGDLSRFLFAWEHMPGFGRPAGRVEELLWPALISRDQPRELLDMLAQSMTLWRSFVTTLQPQPDTYRETLYHFDETLKCMIRSCVAFREPGQVKDAAEALSDLLPSDSDSMDDCNIRYVWGIWFQVILVICRLGMDQEYAGPISSTLDVLRERKYLDKFIAETDYPDYAAMRHLFGEAA